VHELSNTKENKKLILITGNLDDKLRELAYYAVKYCCERNKFK